MPGPSSSSVIDLTGPSPPARTRALSVTTSDEEAGSSTRPRKRVRRGGPAPGPRGRGSGPAREVVTIDSDDDDVVMPVRRLVEDLSDDDDVIVVDSVASGSGSRNGMGAQRASGRGTRSSFSPLPRARVAAAANAAASGSSSAANARLRDHLASTGRRRARSPPSLRDYGLGLVNGTASGSNDVHIYADQADHSYAVRALLAGSATTAGQLVNFGIGNFLMGRGGSLMAEAAELYRGAPAGLQGVIVTAAQEWASTKDKDKARGKKFGVRMSHPRRVEEGFSRDIVPGNDADDEEEVAWVGKGKGKAKQKRRRGGGSSTAGSVAGSATGSASGSASAPSTPTSSTLLEPVCADCLEPLLLAQVGERRPWALVCGHVVCGKCLGEARMRCEEIRECERKARWQYDVDAKGTKQGATQARDTRSKSAGTKGNGKTPTEVILIDDDDDDDEEDAHAVAHSLDILPKRVAFTHPALVVPRSSTGFTPGHTPIPASSKSKGKGKGKGKSSANETGIEEDWTTCPVETCSGQGTDLLAKEGDYDGPFELFV